MVPHYCVYGSQKKAQLTVLISDRTDFKARESIRGKRGVTWCQRGQLIKKIMCLPSNSYKLPGDRSNTKPDIVVHASNHNTQEAEAVRSL